MTEKQEHSFIAMMLKAQRALQHVPEDGANPHFGSKYATLEATWDYVKPIFNEHGILIQKVSHQRDDGVAVETIFYGWGESMSSGVVPVQAQKSGPHAFGSALTYARRYSLALACGVGGDEDDDANQAQAAEKSSKPKKSKPSNKTTRTLCA